MENAISSQRNYNVRFNNLNNNIMKLSIIGKSYIPNDTSYCINLSYPGRDVRLAGSSDG